MARKDLLGRLADKGEDALNRLATGPAGDRLVAASRGLRARVDAVEERTRRTPGLEELQRRVDELERRLADLEARPAASRSRAAGRPPGAKTPGPSTDTKRAAAEGAASAAKRSTRSPRRTSGGDASTGRSGGESPG